MNTTNNQEKLLAEFKGMSQEESVKHQTVCWAAGVSLHNPIRDECCPDFSCCGSTLMPQVARTKLLEAYLNGDNEIVQEICMMGLSGLTAEFDTKVHIVGEPVETH